MHDHIHLRNFHKERVEVDPKEIGVRHISNQVSELIVFYSSSHEALSYFLDTGDKKTSSPSSWVQYLHCSRTCQTLLRNQGEEHVNCHSANIAGGEKLASVSSQIRAYNLFIGLTLHVGVSIY